MALLSRFCVICSFTQHMCQFTDKYLSRGQTHAQARFAFSAEDTSPKIAFAFSCQPLNFINRGLALLRPVARTARSRSHEIDPGQAAAQTHRFTPPTQASSCGSSAGPQRTYACQRESSLPMAEPIS